LLTNIKSVCAGGAQDQALLTSQTHTMTQTKLQPYLQTLMQMRQDLLARITQQRGGQISRADVAFAHFDHTQDDPGEINTERDIEFAINENETAQLQSIDEALKRITQGVYGLCE
jgi:DnaK suppressor protein